MRWLIIATLVATAAAAPAEVDGPSLAHAMRDGRPFFLKFDTAPCQRCRELDGAWAELAREYPGLIGRVDCTRSPDVCDARQIAFDPDEPVPTLKFWTGTAFRVYTGPHEIEYFRVYLRRKVQSEEVSERLDTALRPISADELTRAWRVAPSLGRLPPAPGPTLPRSSSP